MKKILIVLTLILELSANIFNDKELARKTGDKLNLITPAYAFLLTIYNDDFIDGNKQFLSSLVLTQITSETLKRITKEKRPHYKKGDKKHSFPSGHTAGSFSAATFVHKRYGIQQAIIPYALASYVGYSRVKAKKHHLHDVLAGALIAGGFSYFLVDEKMQINTNQSSIMINFNLKF